MASNKDYFGYTKQVYGPGNIATTPMVLLAIQGGGNSSSEVRLAQNVTINYQRTVAPHLELGSDSVWFTAGGAQGNVSVTRAVGNVSGTSGSLLRPYKPGDPCATQTLTIQKGEGSCGLNPGTVKAVGLLTTVSSNMAVQSTIITDSATWTIGSLSIN